MVEIDLRSVILGLDDHGRVEPGPVGSGALRELVAALYFVGNDKFEKLLVAQLPLAGHTSPSGMVSSIGDSFNRLSRFFKSGDKTAK